MLVNNSVELQPKDISHWLNWSLNHFYFLAMERYDLVTYYRKVDDEGYVKVNYSAFKGYCENVFGIYDLICSFRKFCGYKTPVKKIENRVSELREIYTDLQAQMT